MLTSNLIEVGATLAAEFVRRRRSAATRGVVIAGIAGGLGTVGMGFLLAALYIALLPDLGPLVTCIVIGAGLLVVAACLAAWAGAHFRGNRSAPAQGAGDGLDVNEQIEKLGRDLGGTLEKSLPAAMLAAFAAGLASGLKGRRRN